MTAAAARRPGVARRHPLAAFFVLALFLGAGVVALVVRGVLPAGLVLASALSASAAGLLMTWLVDGRNGLRLMARRLFIWRVGPAYWLLALLLIVPIFLLGSVLNPLFEGDRLDPGRLTLALDIVPLFIIFFVAAGLGQELGWTGFLMPRLQARFSSLTAAVIRAVLVGAWHLPVLYYAADQHPAVADFPYGGWIGQYGVPVAVGAMFILFLLPWSVLITWIFNSTGGSLLLAAVLHSSEIWVAYLMLQTGIDPNNLNNYWGYGALMVVAAAVVVVTAGPQNLSRRRRRIGGRLGPG